MRKSAVAISALRIHQALSRDSASDTAKATVQRVLPAWLDLRLIKDASYDFITVDATELRKILLRLREEPGRHIRLEGLVIRGSLDLSGIPFSPSLSLVGCHFTDDFDISNFSTPLLNVSRSTFHGAVTGEGLIVRGDLFARGVRAVQQIDLMDARIGGQFVLDGAILEDPTSSLLADGIHVTSGMFANGVVAYGSVQLTSAKIGSMLTLDGSDLRALDECIRADRLEVSGDVSAGGAHWAGHVRLSGSKIEGALDISDATLGGIGESLAADQMVLLGDLMLGGTCAAGTINVSRSDIRGSCLLDGADLNGSPVALNAQNAAILKGFRGVRLWSAGTLNFESARVTGRFDVQGAVVTAPDFGIDAAHATFGGMVNAWNLRSHGQILLQGAQIDGPLLLKGAVLTSSSVALGADNARIMGGLNAEQIRAAGELRLLGVEIRGQLILENAILEKNGNALSCDRLKVAGNVFLDAIESNGAIRLHAAEISGQLVVDCAARIDMPGARIDELWLQSHPSAPAPVVGHAMGWSVGTLQGVLSHDRRAAARILDRETTAQPWQELANCYERMGQPADARWLRYRSAVRSTKGSPFVARLSRTLYRLSTGHGFYPWIASIWLALIFSVSLGLAHQSASRFVVPLSPSIRVDIETHQPERLVDGRAPGRVPSGWWDLHWDVSPFSSRAYAASIAFPAADAGRASPWMPPTGLLSYAFAALKLGAWGFTLLLVAGLTGLLRRST